MPDDTKPPADDDFTKSKVADPNKIIRWAEFPEEVRPAATLPPSKPETIEVVSGNHIFRATDRGGFGWEIDVITSGPFASGLTRERAVECMDRLKAAHITRKRSDAPPRAVCRRCGRGPLAVDAQGRLHPHDDADPAPGRKKARCLGSFRPWNR